MTTIKARRNDNPTQQISTNQNFGFVCCDQFGSVNTNVKSVSANSIINNSGINWVQLGGLDSAKYNNSNNYYNNFITVSGSIFSTDTILGLIREQIDISSEFMIQSRYIVPNISPIIRFDFVTYTAIASGDSSSYINFGIRTDVNNSHTNASQKKNISFKIYFISNVSVIDFKYCNQTVMSSSNSSCNISNTFPTLRTRINKWGLYLFSGGCEAIMGWYDAQNIFNANCYFQDINNGYGAIATYDNMWNASIYKIYHHIYNASPFVIYDNFIDWKYYVPVKYYENIYTPLTNHKSITFDYVTHTYASSNYEDIFWIRYVSGLTSDSNIFTPIVAVCKFYNGSVNSNVQLMYVSDNSNTTSGETTTLNIIFQPNRAVTTTNGKIAIDSILIPNLTTYEMTIPNAYLYLGFNDGNSYPCLYCQAKGISTNTIQFSVTLYCI